MAEVTNYIDRLVAELCPDGVEYRPIEELFTTRNGYTPSKSNSSYWENGTVPWFRMEDIRENGGVLSEAMQSVHESALKKGGMFPAGSIIVATSATIGEHALINVDFLCNQRFTVLILKDEFKNLLSPKFIYYYSFILDRWCLSNTTQSSFASVDMKRFKKFEFPVPPLEIQEAIVEILDKFTNLEAELEAELEARTLQYEYYRDLLFEALDCPRVPLGSLGVRNKGIAITASKMRTLEPGNKDVRIFAAGSTFVDTDSSFIPDKGILEGPAIIVKSRGHIGFEYYEGKFTHKNELWSYSLTSDLVEQKFIYYYLLTQAYHLHELARGKSVKLPQLAVKDTDELLVPLPSLEEQQRIVDILDRFDALTSSLSEGLPAELAARRSQYEYYRDQLLTFPRKGEDQ